MQKLNFSKRKNFLVKCYFLCLNMNFACFQLSFEVHNSSVAQNFKFWHFLLENFNFDLCCLHGHSFNTTRQGTISGVYRKQT